MQSEMVISRNNCESSDREMIWRRMYVFFDTHASSYFDGNDGQEIEE